VFAGSGLYVVSFSYLAYQICQLLRVLALIVSGTLFNEILAQKNVWGAVGCHQKNAGHFNDRVETRLRTRLRHDKVVALGENGLDYSGRLKLYSSWIVLF
jgi:ribosome-associated protein YbcJ (S4-like RNA binding protein)